MIKTLLLQQKINERIKELKEKEKAEKFSITNCYKHELSIQIKTFREVLTMMEVICRGDD